MSYAAEVASAARDIRAAGALAVFSRPDETNMVYDAATDTSYLLLDGDIELAVGGTEAAAIGSLVFSGAGTLGLTHSVACAGSLVFVGACSLSLPASLAAAGNNGIYLKVRDTDDLQTLGLVHTGAAGRSYTDVSGVLQTAASNTPRAIFGGTDRRHYINGVATWLLEAAQSTNLVTQSEAIAAWTLSSLTATDNAVASSVCGVALSEVVDADGAATGTATRSVTYTGDGTKAFSVFARRHASNHASGQLVRVFDSTAGAARGAFIITWNGDGSVASVTATTGVSLGSPAAMAGGIYRFSFQVPSVVAANTNVVQIYATGTTTSSDTGSAYWGGVQSEDGAIPTSYIKTIAATVYRVAETAYFPFSGTPTESTIYISEVERAGDQASPSTTIKVHVGTAGGVNSTPNFQIRSTAASGGWRGFYRAAAGTEQTGAITPATWGSGSELRLVVSSTGRVLLGLSVDGGAESATAQTAGTALESAWDSQRIYLGAVQAGGGGSFVALRSMLFLRSTKTMAECRVIAA